MQSKQQLSGKETAIVLTAALLIFAVIAGIAVFMANKQESELHGVSLAKQRAEHPTHLLIKGPAPQGGASLRHPPNGAQYVQINGDEGRLGAWLISPSGKGKHPAVLWAHGGFAVGPGDFDQIVPFVNRGFVVLMPAWRGENGNPGHFEMCYGEVSDAAAALKYLATLPQVDRSNILPLDTASVQPMSCF